MTPLAARRRRLAQVMRRIRRRVTPVAPLEMPPEAPAAPDPTGSAGADALAAANIQIPKLQRHATLVQKNRYRLHEFLDLHDRDFVRGAYLGLLGREPDDAGGEHHLSRLRQGAQTKIEILGRIRYSPEGRARKVRVSGLRLPLLVASLYRIPVLGYALRLPVALLRLPRSARNFARMEAYLNTRFTDVEASVDSALGITEQLLQRLDQDQARLRLRGEELQGNLAAIGETKADTTDLAAVSQQLRSTAEAFEEEVAALSRGSARREAVDALERQLSEASNQLARDRAQLAEFRSSIEGQLESQRAETVDRATQLLQRIEGEAERLERLEAQQRQTEERSRGLEHREEEQRQSLARLADELTAVATRTARLDDLVRRVDEIAVRSADGERVEHLAREIEQLDQSRIGREQLDEAIARIEEQLEMRARQLEAAAGALRAEGEEWGVEQGTRLAALEATSRSLRLALHEQQRKHDVLLEEARKKLRRPRKAQVEAIVEEGRHARDEIYARLEDHFRGSTDSIEKGLQEYLPIADASVEATGGAPLLDLGCGRGEWLKLASEQGWRARGIDPNRLMVQRCLDQDLDVEEGDALTVLRATGSDSLSVVTAIHVVEHVPFDDVVALVDEAFRVLKRGGVLILETPNPENLIVGACNFYADPTHRSPIFPPTLEFVVRERGFDEARILRLQRGRSSETFDPLPADAPLAARLNPILEALEQGFTAAPDYAVVGRKD